MSDTSKAQLCAAAVFVAPVVLLAGFLFQPYIGDFTDAVEYGEEVAAGPTRWVWSQAVIAFGLVLLILAVFSIRIYLRDAGEDRWSFLAVPLVTVGAAMSVFVTGFVGLAGWTVAELGGGAAEMAEFFDQNQFRPFLFTRIIFSLGLLSLALAVKQSGKLADSAAGVVVAAIVVNVIAWIIHPRFGAITYVVGVTAIVALWPIAYQMWQDASTQPTPSRPAEAMG